MESRDFCKWLGEVLRIGDRALTAEETSAIRQRLSEVFVHHIDPSLGDEAHQMRLRRIHQGDDAPAAPC